MIPLSLTLQGVYSYSRKQLIDFKRLTDAGLFGIFGSVGSGKSTILEAVSYALYGRTERLHQRDNVAYNMMNLRSNEMFIEFDFAAGKPSRTYRFSVRCKRNSRRFDNVRTPNRSAYAREDNEWVPLETTDAEKILGLSYENFRRTIIIPQGKFQEFLQLSSKDRTTMLRDLFGLDRFDLSAGVSRLETENAAEYNRLQGEAAGFRDISQEALERILVRHKEAVQKLKEHGKRREDLEKREQNLRASAEIHGTLEKTRTSYEDLKTKEPDIRRREEHLERYENCRNTFSELLRGLDEESRRGEEIDRQISEKKNELSQIEEELQSCTKRIDELQAEVEVGPRRIETAHELSILVEVHELKRTEADKRVEARKAAEEPERLRKKREALEQKILTLEREIEELRSDLGSIEELLECKNWFLDQRALTESVEELQKRLVELERVGDDKLSPLMRQVQAWIPDGGEGPIAEIRQRVDTRIESLVEERTRLQEHIDALKLRAGLADFARELKDGAPCPLCGALEHPSIYDSRDSHQTLTNKQKALKRIDTTISEGSALLVDISSFEAGYAERRRHRDQLTTELAQKRNQLSEREKSFRQRKQSFDEYDTVERELAETRSKTKRIEELEKTVRSKRDVIRETAACEKQWANRLRELENQVQALAIEKTTKTNSFRHLNLVQWDSWNDDDIRNEAQDLLQTASDVEKGYNEAQARFRKLSDRKNALHGAVEEKMGNHEESLKRTVSIRNALSRAMSDSKFADEVEIRRILAETPDVSAEREECAAFRREIYSVGKELVVLQKRASNHPYSEEEHAKTRKLLDSLVAEMEGMHRELGKLESAAAETKVRLKRKVEIQDLLSYRGARSENLRILKGLFKGGGFVRYVSTVYLEQLFQSANARFTRLTRKRLRLEPSTDGEFYVRDFLNEGRLRSVKTLSGGQMFQASLSLALALAESVQSFADEEHNFFFLDEGFGSQDPESLRLVFETLQSLRRENRIVGLISHVEELQQEVDTYLRIENDEENGSTFKPSWT